MRLTRTANPYVWCFGAECPANYGHLTFRASFDVKPGELVTAFDGYHPPDIRYGLVISVEHDPQPLGDYKYICTVLWM